MRSILLAGIVLVVLAGCIGNEVSGPTIPSCEQSGDRTQCYLSHAKQSLNASTCAAINGQMKDICYYRLASELNDTGVCAQINEENADFWPGPGNRRADCLYRVAVKTGNTTACETIEHKDFRTTCRAITTADAELCKFASDPILESMCYETLAEQTNTFSLCQQISLSNVRADCTETLAIQQQNTTLCTQLDHFEQSRCTTTIAAQTGNTTPCTQLRTDDDRIECAANAALTKENAGLCESLADRLEQGFCLSTVLQNATTSSICTDITTESMRSRCLEQTQ